MVAGLLKVLSEWLWLSWSWLKLSDTVQGMNSKAAAAKEKKDQAKDAEKTRKAKADEDAKWAAAGEGARTKSQTKKDDQVSLA